MDGKVRPSETLTLFAIVGSTWNEATFVAGRRCDRKSAAVSWRFVQFPNISSRRRCISSWERDSMGWETIQTWPKGSSMRPARYP